jgi:hypothetical protein
MTIGRMKNCRNHLLVCLEGAERILLGGRKNTDLAMRSMCINKTNKRNEEK